MKAWITRVSAAAREYDMSYSAMMNNMVESDIQLNRKVLSELAIHEPKSFEALVSSQFSVLSVRAHAQCAACSAHTKVAAGYVQWAVLSPCSTAEPTIIPNLPREIKQQRRDGPPKTGKGVYPSLPSPHPNPRTAPELSSQTACTGVKCTCHAETCACLMTLTQHLTRLNECERPNLAKTEQKKQEKASRISICNRNMHDGGGAHGGRDEGEGGGEERGRRDRIPGSDGLAREQFCSATATSHPRLLSTTARWQDFCVKFTIFNEPPHPPFLIAAYTCTAATV